MLGRPRKGLQHYLVAASDLGLAWYASCCTSQLSIAAGLSGLLSTDEWYPVGDGLTCKLQPLLI